MDGNHHPTMHEAPTGMIARTKVLNGFCREAALFEVGMFLVKVREGKLEWRVHWFRWAWSYGRCGRRCRWLLYFCSRWGLRLGRSETKPLLHEQGGFAEVLRTRLIQALHGSYKVNHMPPAMAIAKAV